MSDYRFTLGSIRPFTSAVLYTSSRAFLLLLISIISNYGLYGHAYLSAFGGNEIMSSMEIVASENVSDLKCISHINLSIDPKSCVAELIPSMVLVDEPDCADGLTLAVTGEYNIAVDSHFGIEDVGKTFSYEICCGDVCCWGTVLVEYKPVPTLKCPERLELSCGALDLLPLPDVGGVESSCLPQTFEVYLANEERMPLPDCHPEFTHHVIRTYTASNGAGTTTSCTQNIFLKRPDASNIHFPSGTTHVSCSDTDSYIFNEDGVPFPWITTTGSGTGSGTYLGYSDNAGVPFVCEPSGIITTFGFCVMTGSGTGSGTPLLPPSGATLVTEEGIELIPGNTAVLCNSALVYTDQIVPTDDCKKKVYRTWVLREWWCGGEYELGMGSQIIEVKDDLAPEFTCPDDFTINTTQDCGGDVELPAISAIDACDNGYNVHIRTDQGITESNGGIAYLVAGINKVAYIVSDNCYNIDSCHVNITLKDWTEPVAICERNTVVSINQGGSTKVFASTFDDGSWDECGIANYEARRMASDCDPSDLEFGPYINFCCADVGNELMVVFRVTDTGGNQSECMVMAEIQDKTTPQLICPTDQDVDCNAVFDITNLSLTYGEVIVNDDCLTSNMVEESISENRNQCGVGDIIRTFTISQGEEVIVQCKQAINFEPEIYDEDDIVWPEDRILVNTGRCNVSDLLPQNLEPPYDFPVFPGIENYCSLLGYDYEDRVTGQGDCMKIERTWSVIDWCTQVNGQFVVYTYARPQIIEIRNTKSPEIVFTADPIEFISSDLDCRNGDVDVIVTASNTCQDGLTWSHRLLDRGGNVIQAGTGNRLVGTYTASEYTIEWTATNSCGVSSTRTQRLNILNTKAPVPVCMTAMTAELVNESFTLLPSMVNVNSYSPCGNIVTVSFSEDGTLTSIPYDCSDIQDTPYPVQLWVEDTVTGNNDFCITMITVEDEIDRLCPLTVLMATIAGDIYTEDYQSIEEVEVSMASSMPTEMTNTEGYYAFSDMPIGGQYMVNPTKNVDHLNGVSTLDLILIQRHILGLQELGTPYKLLAADVNSSEDINGIDLVELRKLILGVYQEFPNNTSWRFIDAAYDFEDQTDPWISDLTENYEIPELQVDMEIDFIGVKIGDVNGSAATLKSDEIANSRNQRWPLVFQTKIIITNEGLYELEVAVENYENISGWQTTLDLGPSNFKVHDIDFLALEDDIEVHVDENLGFITFSCAHTELISLTDDSRILAITLSGDAVRNNLVSFNSKVTESEAYRHYDIVPLNQKDVKQEPNARMLIAPNPWLEKTMISFDMATAGNYKIELFDVDGKLIYGRADYAEKGLQVINIHGSEINYSGVIYIQIITPTGILQEQTIKIKR